MRIPGKRTTLDDIARQLNISKNSVSLALNNKPGVGEELRQRIIDTALQMGYGSFSAQGEKRSRCIVVIVPEYLHNDAYFYSDIFWAVEREVQKRGFVLATASVSAKMEQEAVLPGLVTEVKAAGYLVIGVVREAYLKKLQNLGLPLVTVDITYSGLTVSSVDTANLAGGYAAAAYLVQRGHREIGFIGPISAAQSVYERWCGFHQALRRLQVKDNPAYHITGADSHFQLLDTAENLEPYLDGLTRYPTAWFCAGDRIALTLMGLLSKRGLSVPRDISVMGFDDIAMSNLFNPPLTTMRVNRKQMGKLAVERLIELMESPGKIFTVSLPVSLIVRESVSPPGGGIFPTS